MRKKKKNKDQKKNTCLVFTAYRCILSPVSSAVILPTLLDFKQRGLGEDKGIITLVMAACSFDDIFCISAFGVCLSIIFSQGKK